MVDEPTAKPEGVEVITYNSAARVDHPFTGDRAMVADFLIRFEQQHHDAGWGKTPATVYRLSWASLGNRPVPLVAPCQLRYPSLRPAEELLLMAVCVADPDGVAALENRFDEPPVAHCLIIEIKVQLGEAAVDMRQGLAWVGDKRILLQRTRGNEPRILDPGDMPVIGMDASLRDIHTAAMRHWSRNEEVGRGDEPRCEPRCVDHRR